MVLLCSASQRKNGIAVSDTPAVITVAAAYTENGVRKKVDIEVRIGVDFEKGADGKRYPVAIIEGIDRYRHGGFIFFN